MQNLVLFSCSFGCSFHGLFIDLLIYLLCLVSRISLFMNNENRIGDRASPWRTPAPTLTRDNQISSKWPSSTSRPLCPFIYLHLLIDWLICFFVSRPLYELYSVHRVSQNFVSRHVFPVDVNKLIKSAHPLPDPSYGNFHSHLLNQILLSPWVHQRRTCGLDALRKEVNTKA